jgi:hypothetical protein
MTTPVLHHRLLLLLLLPALALAACTTDDAAPPDDPATVPGQTGEDRAAPQDDEGRDGDGDTATDVPWSEVEIDGDEVVLLGAGEQQRTVAQLDPDQHGEVLHASLRPGTHTSTTVLLLTRTGDRYELRYLVMSDGETELYGFPWRLQIDEELTRVSDVAPTPVWSPDGSAVAWLEWDSEGTRLRTVGWIDHGPRSNPSDDARSYRVDEVPVGTQLDRWEGRGSRPALHGHHGEKEWRIELDLEDRAVALPV